MLKTLYNKAVTNIRSIGNVNKLTHREYEASLNALNIFFGAIIGVSLGNIENMETIDYVVLLVVTSVLVSMILLVSYSHRRIWNAAVLTVVLGFTRYDHLQVETELLSEYPPKLLPTLSVWAVMAFVLEFSDRTAEPDKP